MNDDFGMLDYEMWLDSFDDKQEEPMNEAIDRITQEVHDRSKVLRNVSEPVVYYLVNFYADDNGLKRSKVNPIDAAEYFDDYVSTGAILLDLWWDANLSDSNAQELALADPKFVETLRKLGEECGVDKDADGNPSDDKMTDADLFRWNFIDGVDELKRDEIIEDFKKMYYGIKEEFSVAELDKFATDDSYDDPFNVDFDCENGECEKEQEQEDELGKKVPEIADFSGSVELGHEPETAVNVSRSSSSFGGRKESIVDINVQCEDDEESITDALKELICSLGLEDEFDVDSCCDGEKCPEEPVAEPAAEQEEVKDLSDEDEVKVKMPAEVADDVKDGDMLVVKVDNKDEEEKELTEGLVDFFKSKNIAKDLATVGYKKFIVRISSQGGPSQKAKDYNDEEIKDRVFDSWAEADKYAKEMSGNKKLDQYAYVKILKDANSAVADYDASADNFAISTGLLYSGGKMSEKSSAKLDRLLAGIKQHNKHDTAQKDDKKQGTEDVEAEKPAVEKSVDSKSTEPTESESAKSEISELTLSQEEIDAITNKINSSKYDKKLKSMMISMLKNVGILNEDVESAEEDDDMSEEEFLEELGKELKNSRECKEAWNAHDNFANPGVIDESPELEGTDNAVKECKPYKLVAHCEEENIDCEMKKPALDKPLLEDINNIFDLFEAKDMKDDELPVDPEAAKLEVHTMLNDLVADEIEAINGYDDAKAEIMDTPIEHKDNILDTIDHIKEEEQEHIDELIGATTEIPFEKEERQDFAAEEGELAEETHAKYAKPEGDRVAAYNNALKYAKKENKPFIYGYTQMGDGKFFALEQPIKISSSPAEAEEEFKNKYKRCSTVYTVYPDKEFVDESLKEEKINIDYVVSLFGDDSHYYKEKEDYNDVPLSPDILGATKFNKKKDISILDIVKDICEYESKYMPENEVASLFDLDTVEEVYEKDEDYFISSGLVKIITVYKNKKIDLPESLKEDEANCAVCPECRKEDTVIDDFPEPEGEPMSDKEIEEAMGIKEPEEK